MLHQLHVLRQAPHGRAALAVERDGEELAVAAGRDQGAEGLALEEADAGELGGRDARGAGEELTRLRSTHSTPVHMLVVGPFADVSRDFEEFLNTCAEQMCKAACQGMQPDDQSEYLSVVVSSVRKEMGMTIARETARMHQDMACELAAGRVQELVPDRFPPPGIAGVGDYFDDDHDEAVVVGTL